MEGWSTLNVMNSVLKDTHPLAELVRLSAHLIWKMLLENASARLILAPPMAPLFHLPLGCFNYSNVKYLMVKETVKFPL